jgi:chemotaxis protein methyltransferase CheR
MKDLECVEFLQWALPRLRLRWPGFRKVRRQACKRIDRRMRELGLHDAAEYRNWLDQHPEEWILLDEFCRITISRFYRDRGVFDVLRTIVLPELAGQAFRRGDREIRCWSAGCASGEEPYSLGIIWQFDVHPSFPGLHLQIVATDSDETLLDRARSGCYPPSSLNDLPAAWRSAAFSRKGTLLCIKDDCRAGVAFVNQDIRVQQPDGPFHLILCRNLVFTYFAVDLQAELLAKITERLLPNGYLMVRIHELLPANGQRLIEIAPRTGIYQRK